MNAQLNSTNFQQFVASNKGKKITFKHNDTEISKVVVDVCGDYFTCKNQESDAKIDGFYYFSECQPVNESLIDVLQKHKVVVIKCFHVDYIFRYSHTTGNVIYGVNLNTTNNLSFSIEGSIKEVWAIVDCKYSQVWKEEDKEEQPVVPKEQPVASQPLQCETDIQKIISTNKNTTVVTRSRTYNNFCFVSQNKKVVVGESNGIATAFPIDNILSITSSEGSLLYLNKEQPVVPKEQPVASQPLENFTDLYSLNKSPEDDIVKVLSSYSNCTVNTPLNVFNNFNFMSKDKNIIRGTVKGHPISFSTKSVLSIIADGKTVYLHKYEEVHKEKRRFDAFKAMGKEWIILTENFNTDVSDKFGKVIKRMMVEEYSPELYNEFCSSYESLRTEVSKNMKQFKSLPQIQAISKRLAELTNACKKVCDDEPIDDLVEKINKLMSVEGKNKYSALFGGVVNQVKIEYRGKPKTVEIINEYTLANGKQYIMVKDITDHDKTKTLFKEYVKYM